MSEEMKLKSCPFCGGEGLPRGSGIIGWTIVCKDCGARVKVALVDLPVTTPDGVDESTRYTKEEAMRIARERWNRRSEAEAEQIEIDNALYRQENRLLQEELEKAHDEAVKDFSYFLIDKAVGGSIAIDELPDIVVEWGSPSRKAAEVLNEVNTAFDETRESLEPSCALSEGTTTWKSWCDARFSKVE